LKDRAAVLSYCGTSPQQAQETIDVMTTELVRLGDGVGEDELDRLKVRLKSTLVMQQESSSSRCSSIAGDWYHLGRVRSLDEVQDIIGSLTAAKINEYLAAHPPRDFAYVTLGPQPLEIPRAVS